MTDSNRQLREKISTHATNLIPYNRYGKPIEGMHWIPLSGELLNGQFESFLLKMDPGTTSKPHEHMGFEEFLMIEGQLIDDDGTEFNQGDFVRYLPGSKHSSMTPNGCTLLVMLRGNNRALGEDEYTQSNSNQ